LLIKYESLIDGHHFAFELIIFVSLLLSLRNLHQ